MSQNLKTFCDLLRRDRASIPGGAIVPTEVPAFRRSKTRLLCVLFGILFELRRIGHLYRIPHDPDQ
jgi:hypothetical protein